MRIETAPLSSSRRATVYHPVSSCPNVVPRSWEQSDLFEPSTPEDDAELIPSPALDIGPVVSVANPGERRRAGRAQAPYTRAVEKAPQGPSDVRLLTAGGWDAVRVKRFPTPSPVVAEAQRHLGLPYAWRGADLRRGVDCSGFAYQVYRRNGHHVPLSWFRETSIDARRAPQLLERHGMKHVMTPQPGDVVVFGTMHVGIYAGAVRGQGLYIGANHGGPARAGRVDVQTVASYYGVQPVYYRYAPKKMRDASPAVRSNTVRTPSVTSPPLTSVAPEESSSTDRTR